MKRLKELRTKKKMSQQALADILHVTQQSVFKYEHDMVEPDLDILKACADYFHTSIDYLIGYTDIPYRYEVIASDSDSMTDNERLLLEYYRGLSPKAKELIQELIRCSDTPSDQ